jgi:hypothetical protein
MAAISHPHNCFGVFVSQLRFEDELNQAAAALELKGSEHKIKMEQFETSIQVQVSVLSPGNNAGSGLAGVTVVSGCKNKAAGTRG